MVKNQPCWFISRNSVQTLHYTGQRVAANDRQEMEYIQISKTKQNKRRHLIVNSKLQLT